MKLNFFKNFAQLQNAIFLLLVIAIFSILGTIIEQDKSLDYYQNQYSSIFFFDKVSLFQIIIFFGINHVYRTWWFFTLLFLFASCLIICTFLQQFPLLKLARRCNFKFNVQEFENQEYFTILNFFYFFLILNNFKAKKYNIFQQKRIVYVYKGILGRFAPIVVHLAMLLILIGNVIAALGSFNSQELIVKGEIFQLQNIITKNYFSNLPENSVRINDFWIEYGQNSNVEQFYSDLSILDKDGIEEIQKTINVNLPLRFHALTFYQTDWNVIGLRIRFNEQIYQLPLNNLPQVKNLNISWIPINELNNKGLIFIINNLKGTFSLYSNNGEFLGTFTLGDSIIDNFKLEVIEFVNETGLQIKLDPGIPLIFFGFGLLMISSLISYFSFTQFWLSRTQNKFFISGTANRAKLNLRIEFLALIYDKE
jgi:cytochrome c biogenesis protein